MAGTVSDGRSRLQILRDTCKAFHQNVRFNLHDVQLRGVDKLIPMNLYQLTNGQLDTVEPIPISRIHCTFDFENQKIDSAFFDEMALFMSDHIRLAGKNLRSAWDETPVTPTSVHWHQGGGGLRLSGKWFGDTITFVTQVQPCSRM
jgi:hypothetical protein